MADGQVTLVGAGPGHRDLLTLGGMEALAEAEVVLYDQLVGEEILAMMPPAAELVDVGKHSGNHTVPQQDINRLILQYAQKGRRVVRLKGGDPYLFGRGAEELELLAASSIPFRVIPGVTSPVAVPAYAGIPVTHRDYASSVHILTGHGKRGEAPKIDYEELVKLRGTLVFLMGVSALEELCAGLLAAGMDGGMPAALIQSGTTPAQRRLVSTVAQLPRRAEEENMRPPAVLVVGRVCELAGQMDFTRFWPLWGKRVLTCSSRATGGKLARRLRALGAGVTEFASIEMIPLEGQDPFWQRMDGYGWVVFTSVYGAEQFFAQLAQRGLDIRSLAGIHFAAIGSETARVVRERGIHLDFVPAEYNAEKLAEGLAEKVKPGEKALLYRAQEGTPVLAETLAQGGVDFEECPAYRTEYRNPGGEKLAGEVAAGAFDLLTFTSASSVKGFAAALPAAPFAQLEAVCIGESTAAAARALGITVRVSPTATVASMAEYIAEVYANGTGS